MTIFGWGDCPKAEKETNTLAMSTSRSRNLLKILSFVSLSDWLAQDCRNLSTDSRSPESTVKRQETKDAWPFCLLYLSISVHLNVCEITERPVVFADQPEIITQPPIITVVGKAFFDIGHAPAGHSNRRTDLRATPDSSGDETRCSSWEAKSRHVEKA